MMQARTRRFGESVAGGMETAGGEGLDRRGRSGRRAARNPNGAAARKWTGIFRLLGAGGMAFWLGACSSVTQPQRGAFLRQEESAVQTEDPVYVLDVHPDYAAPDGPVLRIQAGGSVRSTWQTRDVYHSYEIRTNIVADPVEFHTWSPPRQGALKTLNERGPFTLSQKFYDEIDPFALTTARAPYDWSRGFLEAARDPRYFSGPLSLLIGFPISLAIASAGDTVILAGSFALDLVKDAGAAAVDVVAMAGAVAVDGVWRAAILTGNAAHAAVDAAIPTNTAATRIDLGNDAEEWIPHEKIEPLPMANFAVLARSVDHHQAVWIRSGTADVPLKPFLWNSTNDNINVSVDLIEDPRGPRKKIRQTVETTITRKDVFKRAGPVDVRD